MDLKSIAVRNCIPQQLLSRAQRDKEKSQQQNDDEMWMIFIDFFHPPLLLLLSMKAPHTQIMQHMDHLEGFMQLWFMDEFLETC